MTELFCENSYRLKAVFGSCVDLLIANSEFPFMKTQSFEISFSDYHHMNILFSKQNL